MVAVLGAARVDLCSQEPRAVFSPPLTTPEALAPYLSHVEAGSDAFTTERDAEAIEATLRRIGTWIRGDLSSSAFPAACSPPAFGCARLWSGSSAHADGPLQIARGGRSGDAPVLDPRGMMDHLREFATQLGTSRATEFQVTGIDPPSPSAPAPASAGQPGASAQAPASTDQPGSD